MLLSATVANDSDTRQNMILYTSDAWKYIRTSALSIIMLTYEASVK